MTPTLAALAGFIAWTLFLLVVMEAIRSKMVVTKEVPANGFRPDNANLSPFMQRLARAHANCLEGRSGHAHSRTVRGVKVSCGWRAARRRCRRSV